MQRSYTFRRPGVLTIKKKQNIKSRKKEALHFYIPNLPWIRKDICK